MTLAPAAAYSQSTADPTVLARRAWELQQAGDYASSAKAFQDYLKVNPGDPAAHSNLGTVLVKLGRFNEAISEYEIAEKLTGGDPRIELNIALAYSKSGRVTEACKRFDSLHSTEPGEKNVTLLLADCKLQMGDNERVIQLLEPLKSDDSSNLALDYVLGTALIRNKQPVEGQTLLDRILNNGDTAEARFLLGTQSYESGDYPAAVKQLARAIELNPKLPQLQSYYGLALLNTGDPTGASAAFHAELSQNPNDYASNLGLGQILVAFKNFDEATPYLQRALQVRPQSAEAMLALGECLSAAGKLDEARQQLEVVTRLAPNSLDAHRELASVYARLRLKAKAEQEREVADRLQREADAAAPGPALNTLAPDFELEDAAAARKVRLQDYRGKTPVMLVFGSYTCPNFRSSADALMDMYRHYGNRIPFFLIYIREAHATDNWQSTRNEREGLAMPPAKTIEEKQEHAAMCSLKLHLPFPALVDGMDGRVEAAYSAWPSRAFLIGTDGRILYRTGLSQLDFHPEEMEAALRKAIATNPDSLKNTRSGS